MDLMLSVVIIMLQNIQWSFCEGETKYTHDNFYSIEILKGRCLTRCYDMYGRPANMSIQENLYNIYRTNDCIDYECRKCRIPCDNVTNAFSQPCESICLPHGIICHNSCIHLVNAQNDSQTLRKPDVEMSNPEVTCQDMTDKRWPKVYLYWTIQQKIRTNIVFVVSTISGKSTTIWRTLGQIEQTVVPVQKLKADSDYKFRITAVSSEGIIHIPKETNWIRTIKETKNFTGPFDVRIEGQKVHNGLISALMTWDPGEEPSCSYTVYWMISNPQHSDYSRDVIKAPPLPKYWINNLHFGSNYTLHLSSYGNSDTEKSSTSIGTWFLTAECLDITKYNYSICAPDKPKNVSVDVIYNAENHSSCSVNVSWQPPPNADRTTEKLSYLIKWFKIIPIHLSQFMEPHQGISQQEKNVTWLELDDIHWDFNYSITIQTVSPKGHSNPVFVMITHDGCRQLSALGITNEIEEASNLRYILGGLSGLFIIVTTLAVIVAIRTRKQKLKQNSTTDNRIEELNPLYSNGLDYVTELGEDTSFEIDFSALSLINVLGEGAFGKVYRAKLSESKLSKHNDSIVAVKMLKDFYDHHEKKSLLMEIEFMKQLGSHPHIVSFIGCCRREKVCLIMDYCKLGDLRSFLVRYRQHLQKDSYRSFISSEHDSGVTSSTDTTSTMNTIEIQQSRLLSYARQIVLAMEYMASKKFIHRDLAARNILLYDEERLKISDFGLTRDIYERNLYQPTSARRLPYKWMALEAIFDQIFTIKSDVWSFGIVLWEIVTLGGSPYPGIPNKDLFNLLKEGYRMEKPENCSIDVYQIMLASWHPNPHCRPSFSELRKKLESMLEQTKSYINLPVTNSKDYYRDSSSSDQSERSLENPNDHTSYVEMSTKDSILTYETPFM